jgi:hypothetical protein
MQKGAVITADIVNYTKLSSNEQKKLIHIISAQAKSYKLEFYRGDSFQVYLKHPNESLKFVIKLRTAAKKINHGSMISVADMRASIGIGNVNRPIRTLRTASGEAFILSGRNFDNINDSSQKLVIQSEIPSIDPTLKVIAHFVDYLLQRVTSKQAEVIFELLNDHTQTEVAKLLHKSQATISQHLQSAGWPEIEKLLEEFDNLTSQIQ